MTSIVRGAEVSTPWCGGAAAASPSNTSGGAERWSGISTERPRKTPSGFCHSLRKKNKSMYYVIQG